MNAYKFSPEFPAENRYFYFYFYFLLVASGRMKSEKRNKREKKICYWLAVDECIMRLKMRNFRFTFYFPSSV